MIPIAALPRAVFIGYGISYAVDFGFGSRRPPTEIKALSGATTAAATGRPLVFEAALGVGSGDIEARPLPEVPRTRFRVRGVERAYRPARGRVARIFGRAAEGLDLVAQNPGRVGDVVARPRVAGRGVGGRPQVPEAPPRAKLSCRTGVVRRVDIGRQGPDFVARPDDQGLFSAALVIAGRLASRPSRTHAIVAPPHIGIDGIVGVGIKAAGLAGIGLLVATQSYDRLLAGDNTAEPPGIGLEGEPDGKLQEPRRPNAGVSLFDDDVHHAQIAAYRIGLKGGRSAIQGEMDGLDRHRAVLLGALEPLGLPGGLPLPPAPPQPDTVQGPAAPIIVDILLSERPSIGQTHKAMPLIG